MTDLPKSPDNKDSAKQSSPQKSEQKASPESIETVSTVNVEGTQIKGADVKGSETQDSELSSVQITPSIKESVIEQATQKAKNTDATPNKTANKTKNTETKTQTVKTPTMKSTQTPNDNTQTKQTKTGFLWFVTLLNLIVLILLAAGVYWYYTQINQEEADNALLSAQINQQLADLENGQQRNIANIEGKIQNLASNQQTQEQSLDNLVQQIMQNAQTNQALQKRLAEMSGRRPSDWLLAEANYLVNMAGRKVYLEKDIQTAITLLQEADARLEDLNDPALFPVRALIAADVQTLRAINLTSTSSIALAISGMLQKVSALPLDVLQLPEPEPQEDLGLSENVSDWRENLARTWKSIIGGAVKVSDLDAPLEPYLAERQQWLIEQQLKHALAQAQSAVLEEQQALYVASMQTAIALLIEHYKLDDASVSQFVNALQELQHADFTRNLPNKLESQASLKDILESRVQSLYNNMSAPEAEAISPEGTPL